MISERLNIYEYEEILLGVRNRFENSMKGEGLSGNKYMEAGNIWRYAIDYLLGWSPRKARELMNDKMIKALSLEKTLSLLDVQMTNNYIPDYGFIIHHAFPNEIRYDFRDETLDEYKHVAKLDKWAADKIPHDYPKKFFTGAMGIKRAECILSYAVDYWLRGSMTNEELYEFFGNKRKAKKWLKKRRLETPVPSIYETPLEYFHNSMPVRYKDDFLYNEQRFNALMEQTTKEEDGKAS